MANRILKADDTVEYVGEPAFYLHRVHVDGFRDRVRMISEKHLPNTLWALRQVESIQWFIVRDSDGMVVAQSKDCECTAEYQKRGKDALPSNDS
jgi:hypothetical protein